ncbi:MAG: phytanoyl-CoA dioxygenase family protein [bacterium]|nr:phytanoyl-CoA dioxygenase family protein [bacterium]
MSKPIKELKVSNDLSNDPEALRARMAEDGYLFFRKLQDPDKLWNLRREILTVLQQAGWIVSGTDPIEGIADVSRKCAEGDPEYTEGYHQAYRLESFHRSGHWPEVLDMMEKVIGRPIFPHPHKIARLWFPKNTDHTTPIHQDFVHFQGNFETYTCWSPVGNCPIELGGLAVLPGSHKVNRVLDHHFSLGAGSLCVDTSHTDEIWHSTDYEIGDTLIFPSLTIHKALPNLTENKLRVSLDNRYQALEDPVSEHMLIPHLDGLSHLPWETVYENWKTDDLKFYWKDLDLNVIPRDMSYSEKGFKEALDLARNGNEHARYHLGQIIRRDPTTPQATAAKEVLHA